MTREYDKTHYKKLREQILIRDGYTCYYCGQEANTVDHIIPISKGGISNDENMIAACNRCNSGKRDRMAPGSFLSVARRPTTPIGNFIAGQGSTKRHYA